MRLVILTALTLAVSTPALAADPTGKPQLRAYLTAQLGDHPVPAVDAMACMTSPPSSGSPGAVMSAPDCSNVEFPDRMITAQAPERIMAGDRIVLLRKADGSWIAIKK